MAANPVDARTRYALNKRKQQQRRKRRPSHLNNRRGASAAVDVSDSIYFDGITGVSIGRLSSAGSGSGKDIREENSTLYEESQYKVYEGEQVIYFIPLV